jgi:hypothetical protein
MRAERDPFLHWLSTLVAGLFHEKVQAGFDLEIISPRGVGQEGNAPPLGIVGRLQFAALAT